MEKEEGNKGIQQEHPRERDPEKELYPSSYLLEKFSELNLCLMLVLRDGL